MKSIAIEECLLPINATLYGTNFDPPHQMVHACECGTPGEICVSEELYEAMRQHFSCGQDMIHARRELDDALAELAKTRKELIASRVRTAEALRDLAKANTKDQV